VTLKESDFVILRKKDSNKKKKGSDSHAGEAPDFDPTDSAQHRKSTLAAEALRLGKEDGAKVSIWDFSVTTKPDDFEKALWASHPDIEIVYVLSGRAHYSMISPDGKKRKDFDVGAGDVVYVAPGTHHKDYVIGDKPYRGIVISPKPIKRLLKQIYTESSQLPAARV
jgi:mannose-6-phosphate isomerase-like protein (cupin superfamily)